MTRARALLHRALDAVHRQAFYLRVAWHTGRAEYHRQRGAYWRAVGHGQRQAWADADPMRTACASHRCGCTGPDGVSHPDRTCGPCPDCGQL